MRITPDLLKQNKPKLNAIHQIELSLRNKKITEINGLEYLNDSIDYLDLSNNNIKILDNFPKMSRLKHLNVSNNKIERIGDDLYKRIPNLVSLNIANNQISDSAQLINISKFEKLKNLILIGNTVAYKSYCINNIASLDMLDFSKIRKNLSPIGIKKLKICDLKEKINSVKSLEELDKLEKYIK
ncbi:U2 small nuclear ribonucleoprotein A' [Astathelohania contejeani]|uniref:U2 small nuclear ribonucleoprotein A' n=1 Tax=Astathelohania contejeani TaxID=164912 RepID=A0ABQ7I2P0_9MICR|nr:U2 small nuclear ribonucleoprotein A' [Thelohania contejeani]